MNKLLLFAMAVVILILFSFLKDQHPKSGSYVEIDGKTFDSDISKTGVQQEKGLSIYNKLDPNRGMLFVFEKPDSYTFWMKGMKFPIDIIYIRKGRIVEIFKNLPPPKSENESPAVVKPDSPADMVFEINAGLSEKYNFKNGDIVKVNLK